MSMVQVTATEFAKNFGLYRETVRREAVQVTTHGRVAGYYVSSEDYDELQRLRRQARQVYRVEHLPDDLSAAIDDARMDPRHDHLNKLLEE